MIRFVRYGLIVSSVGGAMDEDWLLSRMAAVERAAVAASEELAAVPEGLERARAERLAGLPLPDLARELAASGAVQRRRIAAGYRRYERAVGALRSDVIRALVDEEEVPLSTLARAMEISRQAVTRLYEAGKNLPKGDAT